MHQQKSRNNDVVMKETENAREKERRKKTATYK